MNGSRRVLVSTALGYLIGSIPTADLAARIATSGSVDLRHTGSGNPGGVNAAEVLGRRWGAAVIAADFAKGLIAGLVGRRLGGSGGAYAAATAAIAGQAAPAWSAFRGGKGVATSAGSVAAVFPAFLPLDALVASSATAATRNAQRAMWISSSTWVLSAMLWHARQWPNLWGPPPTRGLVVFALFGALIVNGKFAIAARAERGRT